VNKVEFVKGTSEFYAEIRREGIEASVKDIASLYAIYRKDLRTDRINGNNFLKIPNPSTSVRVSQCKLITLNHE
jgi:hypothetical protein